MNQTNVNPYEIYFEQINEEFDLMNKRLRKLIKNAVALGTENESILREFLRNYIPNHYSVGHGFIFKNDQEISSQCDIIIYDSHFFPPLFKRGDFVILSPESVMSVIEVKTKIGKGPTLRSAIENIKNARLLNQRISGLIFAYRGSPNPIRILQPLLEYCEENNIDQKTIFELMVILDKGYCILPKKIENGKVFFGLDVVANKENPELMIDVNMTGKQSFYLFFYYIMKQIRTYVYNTFIGKSTKFEKDFSFVPLTPSDGLIMKGFFDDKKDEIEKLSGNKYFNEDDEFIGISLEKKE